MFSLVVAVLREIRKYQKQGQRDLGPNTIFPALRVKLLHYTKLFFEQRKGMTRLKESLKLLIVGIRMEKYKPIKRLVIIWQC